MPDAPHPDPTEHAADFCQHYAQDLDIVAGQAMIDVGLPDHQMGAGDPDRLGERFSFHPGERVGGSYGPEGQIVVDSGVMNPNLMDADYDEDTQKLWRKTRLRPRIEAILAHEFEEYRNGMDHAEALKHAPTSEVAISDRARQLCRQMEKGWKVR